jgi:hypothetical protein
MSRALHARWILPFVAAVAGFALWQNARSPHWRTVYPGVEFTTLVGEPYCRLGSAAIAVLRADPKQVRVHVRHAARTIRGLPLDIREWQRRTGAIAVFNAGQYYPDYSYMGMLVSAGDTISARPHAEFQAALVAADGRARVLDLARAPLATQRGWSDVAQSFMLFDRAGGLRVRKTTRIANRTVVGEDARGRIVVCVSEGAYTLADFAELLLRAPLGLTHAMSMDGGLEAEMVVHTPTFRYASFGPWPEDHEPSAPGARVLLPAVVSLEVP